MIRGNLKNWNLDGSEELQLFFAQRMNELLFDYTLDSFKYYSLNIQLLLREASERVQLTKDDLTKDRNLIDIIDEINLKAKSDIVTKSILGPQYEIYFPFKLHDERDNINLKLEILKNKLSLNFLIPRLFYLIEEEIDEGSKKKINILANQLVTALVNVGFHQSFIYYQVNSFFFSGKKQKNRKIKKFFEFFKPRRHEFEAIFKVSNSFMEIKDLCSHFNLEILQDYTIQNANIKLNKYLKSKSADEVFARTKEIKAFDYQSARLIALDKLNTLAGYFAYFHHKNPPQINRSAIVNDNDSFILVEPTTSPMAKGKDMSHKQAAKMLGEFLAKFSVSNETNSKFNRSANLHSHSIQTNSSENRLLNLWIIYETLFGSGKTTTVVHIINSLTNISSLMYFYRIFDEVSLSINKWNKGEFEKIKKLTGEVNDIDAVCSFCISAEYEKDRIEFFEKLNEYPLLRFRMHDLYQNLNSSKKILNYLDKHNKRIIWHIKRLYRTRNRIVHDGRKQKNLDILVENAHTYFDLFMDEFILDNIFSKTLDSIPQAVDHYQRLNESWMRKLRKTPSTVVNKDNFKELILYKQYCDMG